MANPKIVVLRLYDVTLGLQDTKTLKRVKISNSLFRDFPAGVNKIDQEESKSRGPQTLKSVFRAQSPQKSQNFKDIIS